MTTKLNTAEGATTGVAITTGNQGASGDVLTPAVTGTGTVQASTSSPIRGTKSYICNAPVGTDTAYLYYQESGTITQDGMRPELGFLNLPPADCSISQFYQGGGMCTIKFRSTGRIAIEDATGTSLTGGVSPIGTPFVANDFPLVLSIDHALDIGTGTTDGKTKVNIYVLSAGSGSSAITPSSVTPWWSFAELTGQNFFRTGSINRELVGKLSSGPIWQVKVDSFQVKDSYAFQGTVANPTNIAPVAVVSVPRQDLLTGNAVSFTGTATDADGNTLTHTWVVDTYPTGITPTIASGATVTGGGSLTMTSSVLTLPGFYTFKYKANDGTVDSNVVTVTAYVAASDGSISVASRAASNYTGAIANYNDGSDATVVTGPTSPVNEVEVLTMNPCKPNADGTFTFRARKQPTAGAPLTAKWEFLTGVSDTLFATRSGIAMTDVLANYTVTLTSGENAAFTDHGIWKIRITSNE